MFHVVLDFKANLKKATPTKRPGAEKKDEAVNIISFFPFFFGFLICFFFPIENKIGTKGFSWHSEKNSTFLIYIIFYIENQLNTPICTFIITRFY